MAKLSFRTHDQVIRLPITGKQYEAYRDTGKRGEGRLGVRVNPKGLKVWIYRYFFSGKRLFVNLGRVSDGMTMNAAQKEADKLSDMLLRGQNPKEELAALERVKQEGFRLKEQRGTIQQLFEAYTEQMRIDGKRTYKAVLSALEKEIYPHIEPKTKAADVDTQSLVEVLAKIISRGAATQSNRVRSYLMAAFNYGLQHDNNPATINAKAVFALKFNPVSNIPKQKAAERVGNNYLSLVELKEIVDDFSRTPRVGVLPHLLLKLCVFTGGQRPYELIASKWSSVDYENQTLLIIPEISKNKTPHLLPLTKAALDILEELRELSEESEYIFPKSNNPEEHLRTDSLSKAISRYRDHKPDFNQFVARDIRRTCKTLMGELGISKELRDRIQNHALNDVSSKHYDRYDYLQEKRHALELWEQKLIDGLKDNVVTLWRHYEV